MARVLVCAAVLALVTVSCSQADSSTTTLLVPETVPRVTTSVPASTTTTATTPPSSTTTLGAQPTTTTTTEAPTGSPQFDITQVTFGATPFVVVTNSGPVAGSTAGLWLCQRPGYFQLPDVMLEPGARMFVGIDNEPTAVGASATADAGSALGSVVQESGELGLYFNLDARPAFSDPLQIVAYVEWGNSGHGRADVAVAAEIWPLDDFVEVSADTIALTSLVADPQGAGDWFAEIGG